MRRLATVLGVEIDVPAAEAAERIDPAAEARGQTVALFRELREPLGRYLVSLGVQKPEVEEIIQEAFLRLHRHLLAGHGGNQNLQGWVFRVAQNLVRDRRRAWHGRNVESIESRPEAALASAPGETPEERMLQREKMERLRSALEALPESHRRCLQLRSEGLRYREIAIVLGVSITTVADLVRVALAQLNAQLGRARDDD
jgi:RNA polymerase sigma-70 factor (ECF subfamily)